MALQQREDLVAVIAQEGHPARIAPQPEPDGDPAVAQGNELGYGQLLIPCLPGRHDPPADRGAADPDAPVEELQPGEISAGNEVPAHHAAPVKSSELTRWHVDGAPARGGPPDPEAQPGRGGQGHHHDHDVDQHPSSRGSAADRCRGPGWPGAISRLPGSPKYPECG